MPNPQGEMGAGEVGIADLRGRAPAIVCTLPFGIPSYQTSWGGPAVGLVA